MPPTLPPTLFVAVDPEAVARDALDRTDDVFAVGGKADETIRVFCRAIAIQPPALPPPPNEDGQAITWRRRSAEPPELVALHAPAQKSERHTRKYAEGALGEDKSFYFRGRVNALNLRAQNLTLFIQIAGGVDDETWLHHLKAHDYSRWVREAIKDEELAAEIRHAEDSGLDAFETRRRVREAIERRYTAPADSSNG